MELRLGYELGLWLELGIWYEFRVLVGARIQARNNVSVGLKVWSETKVTSRLKN